MIYKIFRENEWQAFKSSGQTLGAPIDLADGFIHFSTASEVVETAAKHFASTPDLWLAAVDETSFTNDLKWEPSRGGVLFPHLYRALCLNKIQWCKPLPAGPSGHIFPPDLE